ncbi:ABC transporter substrate-binding protein [Clostridium hydrogeniformans]|uniref:ABC transporter substrate-binding protein n=1 Tax=Clostridium hydrogeniformans TaxID=349933 RepID=UPI0004893AA9|nr:ABC transporter substrate-binding protein [Clostridium hydrogeniformans]
MKKKSLIALTLGVSLLFTACSSTSSTVKEDKNKAEATSSKSYPASVTNFNFDKTENKITFNKKPERVISTNQTTTELLLHFGLEDQLVGTAYMDNPILDNLKEKHDKIPVLSDKYPTKEMVIEKNPDLIIGWKSAFSDKVLGGVNTWNEKDVNTFIQRNSGIAEKATVENVYKDIEDIGTIFDIKDKTDAYIADMKKNIEGIENSIKDVKSKLKVLVIEGSKDNKYTSYGSNTLVSDMVEKAGGKNVVEKGGTMGPENIVELNPDVIVLIHFEAQVKDNKEKDALLNNPALQSVQAIKDKKILYTPLAETYGGSVRTATGIENLAKGLYPDLVK